MVEINHKGRPDKSGDDEHAKSPAANQLPEGRVDQHLHPRDIILLAFTFYAETYNRDKVSLPELVGIALQFNAPSEEIAEKVIASMVEDGFLGFEKDQEGGVHFYVKHS